MGLKTVIDALEDIYNLYKIRVKSIENEIDKIDVESKSYNMYDDDAYNKFVQEVEKKLRWHQNKN